MVIEFPWTVLIFIIFFVGLVDVVWYVHQLIRWIYNRITHKEY